MFWPSHQAVLQVKQRPFYCLVLPLLRLFKGEFLVIWHLFLCLGLSDPVCNCSSSFFFSCNMNMTSFSFLFPLEFEGSGEMAGRLAASVFCLIVSVSVLPINPVWVTAILLILTFPLINFPWNFCDALPEFSQIYLFEVCCFAFLGCLFLHLLIANSLSFVHIDASRFQYQILSTGCSKINFMTTEIKTTEIRNCENQALKYSWMAELEMCILN